MSNEPKPLIGKILTGKSREEVRGKLLFDYKDIKSACEFWLRYKDNPELLIKEHSEYEKEVSNIKEFSDKAFFREKKMRKYNEWLFRLAFKEVLEK